MTIPTRYNPKEVENKWFEFWNKKGYFGAEVSTDKKPYCIVIPPPNVTGILHMGHALNNIIQDILIRYKRMKGFNALWVPGTDHAGIATQNVVERELSKEGKTRYDLGREKFIEKVWEWTKANGGTIIEQLKKLGCSCDWQRERFTLGKKYSAAVNEVFIKLYNEKLIYRGSYIINWCPRCQTALSDEEAPHKEIQGNLYYIKYPIKNNKEFVVVATTRPETMFGDTALAVNPKDRRFKHLIGKCAILPIAERELEIIADAKVDPEFGTGIVKVTPFHDPNDFDIGNRHKLKGVLCINPDGTMNINATENYKGMDRFEARESLIEDLKVRKLLEKIEPHTHAVGHCYRCHTIIEPYFSEQWFVKMKPLSIRALEVAKKREINFYPQRWLKIYINWMENIKDWCISRQIWWGHRIPAWYCQKCYQTYSRKRKTQEIRLPLKISDKETGVIGVGKNRPLACPNCGSQDIKQDEDVLDTWFSSWLWPFAVFDWPQNSKDLKYFYPTSSLITASEIIFFWVARMIMAGLHFMKDIPFGDVYIHGTVRDAQGRKMSKSLGNAIDPLKIIDKYGADALRFSLISLPGEHLYLSENKFEFGRNFTNKLWNASRLVLNNLDDKLFEEQVTSDNLLEFKNEFSRADWWILDRYTEAVETITNYLDKFCFNEASSKLYEFFWHEFCDVYLENSKFDQSLKNKLILKFLLSELMKLLHPFIPFITEEIFKRLNKKEESVMISNWPSVDKKLQNKEASKQFKKVLGYITEIRHARQKRERQSLRTMEIASYKPANEKARKIFKENIQDIQNLTRIKELSNLPIAAIKDTSKHKFDDFEIYFPILLSEDKKRNLASMEKKKLLQEIKKLESLIDLNQKNLNNKNFLKKARKEVVKATRAKTQEFLKILNQKKINLKELK